MPSLAPRDAGQDLVGEVTVAPISCLESSNLPLSPLLLSLWHEGKESDFDLCASFSNKIIATFEPVSVYSGNDQMLALILPRAL